MKKFNILNNSNTLIFRVYFQIGFKDLNKRYLYNSFINFNSIDPLTIRDGSYSYLKDLSLPKDIKWKTGKGVNEGVGPIGWFSDDKPLDSYGDFSSNVKKLNEIFDSFSPVNSYSLAIIVSQPNKVYKTIDNHYLVNNTTNAVELMKHVYNCISNLTIRYKFQVGDKIICRYKALSIKVDDPKFKGGRIENTIYKPTTTKLNIFNRFLSSGFLPHTMDISYYGFLLSKKDNVLYFQYNDKYIIHLEIIESNIYHKISVLDSRDGLKRIAMVEDYNLGDRFIREFINKNGTTTYLEYDNKFNLLNIEFHPKITFLKGGVKDERPKGNIITFDIETYKDKNNNFIPYACGFYDGKRKYLYYLTDFSNHNDMLSKCFEDIMVLKYNGYTIYAHNLAKFDSIFIYKLLESKYKISKELVRDGGMISFRVSRKIKDGNIKIRFSDSICLLPSSLYELGNSFKVETIKDVFPYDFVNESNLNYIGDFPDLKFFDKKDDNMIFRYQLMVNWFNNDWSVKDETLKYLSKDIISLYQILSKMKEIIFKNYRINMTSHTTIASLAIAILTSNFIKNSKLLPKSKGELENAIRSAYFGGRTEVFKPIGYFLFSYDWNSLYPTGMLEDMPVGEPLFSLIKDLSKIFGFVKVKVTSPDNIYIPVLPCRVKTKHGDYKLIFPVGSWTGWYFSEEVKLAVTYGYKVEVIESYIYKRGKNIFKEYVEYMANIKDSTTGAMRNIHKLLMNTPYGRMGMSNDRDIVKKVSKKEFEQIELRYNISTFFELDNNNVFVRYNKFPDQTKCEQSGLDYNAEILDSMETDVVENSPAIAAAVTAWARILMYPHIVNAYYTDTDSVFLDKPLNSSYIGKGLGKFKQEYGGLIKKAIFPSPKLYILDTIGGLITKSKGYSGKLSMFDYIDFYNGGFVEVNDIRWRRHLELETVTLINQNYTIKSDLDKRNKLYSKGRWVDTSPVFVNENCEIVTMDLVVYKQSEIITMDLVYKQSEKT